jgi:hypothetical protein
MTNVVQFPWQRKRLDHAESRAAAETALAVPTGVRRDSATELHLEDPDLLLSVCELLRGRFESDPASVLDDATFFFQFLESPVREIGLHDEREYFLGEFALVAATASRFLFRMEETRIWLGRAEANFALTQNANAHWARVAYQRMALLVEERKFDEVLPLVPIWANTFQRLEMPEEAIKCRFLESAVRWELGEGDRAIQVNESICVDARALALEGLVAQADVNLVRFKGAGGQTEDAVQHAQEALSILKRLGKRVPLVKLQWSMGDLLRKQNKRSAALEAYKRAQTDAREVGMRGDLAALHLVIADLLLEAGQEAQAEWEIRAALPIIDEEKMVPEGIAALSLLRESLRRRQIDKQALRELHGYFQEK